MYESHWNLTSKPFQPRCAADSLYQSQSLTSALLRLRYCFDNGGGLAALIGESGMGKTSLLNQFAGEPDRWSPFVHVRYSGLQPEELLRQSGAELCGWDCAALTEQRGVDQWLATIRSKLVESAQYGRAAVVAFDDAHQLSDQALEQTVAPLISISESDPGIRLTIVLAGHPVLLSRLQRHVPLAERTEVMCVMQGWSLTETADYIAQTLRRSGANRPVFTAEAVQAIFEWSAGNPRRINRLCDLALLVGFADQREQITHREVEAVSSELVGNAA
jgi:type II secretory pathway predicted ATPase ExeA